MQHPAWTPETRAEIGRWWRANQRHVLVRELARRGYGGVGGMCSYALERAAEWIPRERREVFFGLVNNLEGFAPRGPNLPAQAATYLRPLNPRLAEAAAQLVQPVILGCWALALDIRHDRERAARVARG